MEILAAEQSCVLNSMELDSDFEVSFDGGARNFDDIKVAGAGAVLWGPRDATGDRRIVERARVALPGEDSAPVAEGAPTGATAVGSTLRIGKRPPACTSYWR